jgi:hypothetical protein
MRTITLLLICGFSIINCAKKGNLAAGAALFESSANWDSNEKNAENASDAALLYEKDENNRKFVITADLSIRLNDLKAGEEKLNGIMEKYAAYAAESRINRDSLFFSLKIPSPAYKKCFNELKEIGEIIYCTERTRDVTVPYYDLESRLNTKRELIKTYQSYLGKAKNIEEILSVERQIAELQNEIDRAGQEFKILSNSVDYAAVELELRGANRSLKKETFGYRAKSLLSGFGEYISSAGIAFIGIVVYGIPGVLLLAALYWLLLGKIGLLRKLWRFVKNNKPSGG